MEKNQRAPFGGGGMLLLAAVLTASGLVAGYHFLPLADCPACRRASDGRPHCRFCADRGRVTLPERGNIAVEVVPVSLNCREMPVADILGEMQRQTGVPIAMEDAARRSLNPSKKLSFAVKELSLRSALELFCRPNGLTPQRTKQGFQVTLQYCIRGG